MSEKLKAAARHTTVDGWPVLVVAYLDNGRALVEDRLGRYYVPQQALGT